MTKIKLQGQSYDAAFGMGTIGEFCEEMAMPLARLSEAININPVKFIYTALKNGCRKSGQILPWTTWYDMADYFDDHEDEMAEAIEAMMSSLEVKAGAGKKK